MSKKRLTALVLVVVLAFSGMIIYGQSNDESLQMLPDQARLYDGMTFEEFSQTDLFQDTLSLFVNEYGFTLDYATNYLRTVFYIENLSAVFGDDYGMWVFPDHIGGAYVNSDGVLVLQLTREAMQTATSLNQFNASLSQHVDLRHIVVQEVEFSHMELTNMHNFLLDWAMNSDLRVFNALSVRENYNKIMVDLWDYSPEGIEHFRRTVIDSPMLMFRQARIQLNFGETETFDIMMRIIEDYGLTDVVNDGEQIRFLRDLLEAELENREIPKQELEEATSTYSPFLSSQLYQSYSEQLQSSSYSDIDALNNFSFRSGQAIYRNSNGTGHAGSIGFRVRHIPTGRVGFVTAGHNFPNGGNVWGAQGQWIGTTNLWQNSGNLDVTFIVTQFGVDVTNTMLNGQTISTAWAAPMTGLPVAAQGSALLANRPQYFGRMGSILSINSTFQRPDGNWISGCILTDLYGWPGDSGGPLYWISGSGNVTIGIVLGGFFPGMSHNFTTVGVDMHYVPASRIMQAFQLQRY
ncbi:MAG: S1 family peptidase [Defluviitaleaceae bacterium]|nr:S1 family peptidase [Defluviitaleaceae bacterium]